MNQARSLFFLALLPPLDIQNYVNQIKQIFADNYGSRAALKSPPHITLQPPFRWCDKDVPDLAQCLSQFAPKQEPVPIALQGFGAFPPRVIYVKVLRTPALLTLQADLMADLANQLGIVDPVSQTRPFAPHMTVAFKDLTRQSFKAAWIEFQQRQLEFEFTATALTLLKHDGNQWQVNADFRLG